MPLRRSILLLIVLSGISAAIGLEFLNRHLKAQVVDLGDRNDYSKIGKKLYVGGFVDRPPPGVVAVLNVCTYEDGYKAKYHKWMPILDAGPAPSLEWLKEAVEFVETNQKADRPTYIHCFAGISRSVMVSAAYLMKEKNWTRDQAIEHIKKTRPFVAPNPAFMDRLLEWEKRKRE